MSVGSVPNFSPGTAPKHLTKLLCEKDDRWLEEHGHCLGERLDNFWKRDFSGRSGQKQLCSDVSYRKSHERKEKTSLLFATHCHSSFALGRAQAATVGFPGGSAVKNSLQCRQCKRLKFYPWVGKIPWMRE